MSIKIIACVGKNGELGKNGNLCFHIREDMAFFREKTINSSVLMGRKTWESIGEKPLKNRENFVISSKIHADLEKKGAKTVENLEIFLGSYKNSEKTLFVIGGASLYQMALPYADEIFLTEVDAECRDADVFFPKFDKTLYNRIIIKESSENDLTYTFVKYQKK